MIGRGHCIINFTPLLGNMQNRSIDSLKKKRVQNKEDKTRHRPQNKYLEKLNKKASTAASISKEIIQDGDLSKVNKLRNRIQNPDYKATNNGTEVGFIQRIPFHFPNQQLNQTISFSFRWISRRESMTSNGYGFLKSCYSQNSIATFHIVHYIKDKIHCM